MRRVISAFAVAGLLLGVMAFQASGAAPATAPDAKPAAAAAGPIPAPHPGHPKAVAKVTGGGTAIMTDNLGDTAWWENSDGITLYSDGSATGTFFCADFSPPDFRAMVFGEVTSWTLDDGLISLYVPVSTITSIDLPPAFEDFPGDPFRIQIQVFGGAGVGHWTLDIPDGAGGWIQFCLEAVTSGEITLVIFGKNHKEPKGG